MARTYLVFGDIEGKLDVLRVECIKCPRKSRYSVPRLIEKYWPQTLSTLSPRKCRLLRPKRQRKAFGLSFQNLMGPV